MKFKKKGSKFCLLLIELVDFSDHDRTLSFVEFLRTVEMRKSKCQSYYKFAFVFLLKAIIIIITIA